MGVAICDRWRSYETRFGRRRQLCWAHLDREGVGVIDRGKSLAKSKDARQAFRGDQLVAWGVAFEALVDRPLTGIQGRQAFAPGTARGNDRRP